MAGKAGRAGGPSSPDERYESFDAMLSPDAEGAVAASGQAHFHADDEGPGVDGAAVVDGETGAMELRQRAVELREQPRLTTFRGNTSGLRPEEYCDPEVVARKEADLKHMEDNFAQAGNRLRDLRDRRDQPLIGDDEVLRTLNTTTQSAVIRNNVTGEDRTVELVKYLYEGTRDDGSLIGDAQLIQYFGVVERYVIDTMGIPSSAFPPRYKPDSRGNERLGAPRAFERDSRFKLPSNAEKAVERQLDAINADKKLSKAEKARQSQAVLEVAAASAACVETMSFGLDLEIEAKKRELQAANRDVAQARNNGNERLREVLILRNKKQEELAQLNKMKQELSQVSYLSLMSAERAKPTADVRDDAEYDRAVEEAVQMTRAQLSSTLTRADAYAAGSGMLVDSRRGRDIGAQRQTPQGAHLPDPDLTDRLAITRFYHSRHLELPQVEDPTLRIYDAYNARDQQLARDWSLFRPEMYEGLSPELSQRLYLYETSAGEAMQEASQFYREHSGYVGKGFWSRTVRTSGVATNLRTLIVDPMTEDHKEHIQDVFDRSHPPAPAPAQSAPVVPPALAHPGERGQDVDDDESDFEGPQMRLGDDPQE